MQLAELHLVAVAVQEVRQAGQVGMAGEAQMLDAALLLLLNEIVHDAPLGILVHMDGILIDVVQQVEIKIVHLTLLQLLLKDVGGVVGLRHHVAGELGGQTEALAGVLFQTCTHHRLGHVLHIGPRGIVIVDAVGHGVIHHLLRLGRVDLPILQHRQAHGAKAQHRKLRSLEITIDHPVVLPILYFLWFHGLIKAIIARPRLYGKCGFIPQTAQRPVPPGHAAAPVRR